MRIWSLHPKYLDSKGLVALWREALLARKVLENRTKGYKNHPQLFRFRISENPEGVINYYLTVVYKEALSRKYSFDKDKIGNITGVYKIPVTRGQVDYEFEHLLRKLKTRDSEKYLKISGITEPDTHPLFIVIGGEAEKWEIRTNHNIEQIIFGINLTFSQWYNLSKIPQLSKLPGTRKKLLRNFSEG